MIFKITKVTKAPQIEGTVLRPLILKVGSGLRNMSKAAKVFLVRNLVV